MNRGLNAQQSGLATRRHAAKCLAQCLGGAPFNPFTPEQIPDGRDRAFANRLVSLALRRHGHLDLIITDLMPKGLPKRSGSFGPLLRIALAELLFDERDADHAAIGVAGDLIKADRRGRHHQPLLNAVLRSAQRQRDRFRDLPEQSLFPDWLTKDWGRNYGADSGQAFAAAMLSQPALDISLKPPQTHLPDGLEGTEQLPGSFRLAARGRPVAQLPGYEDGDWWVQDVAATLPARLVPTGEGTRVLDLCAAPGGKTAQLAALGFDITALDNSGQRLLSLRANMQRLGLKARILCEDALKYHPGEPFDHVLLDAPCSALGTFRRHPELIWQRTGPDIAGRAKLQREMLVAAAQMLKPGGALVFATCSLQREEGEYHLDAIAAGALPALRPDPVAPEELPGLEAAITTGGAVRTYPGLKCGAIPDGQMDGFFVARFRRC